MNILGSNSYAKLEAVLNMLGFNKYILSFIHNPYTLFRRSIHFNLKKKQHCGNGIESSEMNPYSCGQLISDKGTMTIQWGK